MFSSIPGLYPLDTSRTTSSHAPCSYDNQHVFKHAISPQGDKIIPCWKPLGQVSSSNNSSYSHFWPPFTGVLIYIILICTCCFINILICFPYSDRGHVYIFISPTATSNSFCLEGSTKMSRNLGAQWFWIKSMQRLPWWCSGWESACQCRGHRFGPWSGKIPPTTERAAGPMHHNYWACALEPASHNYWTPCA